MSSEEPKAEESKAEAPAPKEDTCKVCNASNDFTKTMRRRKKAGQRTCKTCCAQVGGKPHPQAKADPQTNKNKHSGGGKKSSCWWDW